MAYFPRQKRQARFYWAELGFLVMGLFALQPSLLTSLFSNAMPVASSYSDRLSYPISPTYQGLMGRDWAGNQLVQSYMAPIQGWQYQSQYPSPSNWNTQYYSNPNTQLGQAAYANPSSLAGVPYSPFQSSNLGSHSSSYPGLAGQSMQGAAPWNNYVSTVSPTDYLGNPQPNYYASSYQTTPQSYTNGWPNQTSYVAQANGQWPNTTAPWPSTTGQLPNASSYTRGVNSNSNWPQTSSSNPFNSLLSKSQQTSLYRNGDGSGSYSPAAQRYAYPAASQGFDTWTPYQPSGSSLYR